MIDGKPEENKSASSRLHQMREGRRIAILELAAKDRKANQKEAPQRDGERCTKSSKVLQCLYSECHNYHDGLRRKDC